MQPVPVLMATLVAVVGAAVWNWTEAPIGQHLFVTGLRGSAASETRCGGALIAPTVVLTSATCAWATWVSVGSHYSVGDKDGERIAVANVTVHPSFTFDSNEYNLAVLELKTPSSAPPIPLVWSADATNNSPPTSTWVYRYGIASKSAAELPKHLLQSNTRILSNVECAKFYGSSVKDSWLCAESSVNPNDIGGPLTVVDALNNEFLVGVASWGKSGNEPAVYARIGTARDFIEPFVFETNGTNNTQNLGTIVLPQK
ncbi:hypothetical protein DYB35_006654 [Aphanomyces astaci]|uniref:Peptidase S1 domain-containing protein n=1 Tax=Aphanomyces astaci TaxID=112090 RepID=A0A3R6ZPJ4_APHAT|nr:hypothetical protein DYB35_006654 [Aphanomyces astaci]